MVLRQQAALAGLARTDFRFGDSVNSVGCVHAVALVLVLALAPTPRGKQLAGSEERVKEVEPF